MWLGSKPKTHLFNMYLINILMEKAVEYISLVCRYHNAQSPEMLMSLAMKGAGWCSLRELLMTPHSEQTEDCIAEDGWRHREDVFISPPQLFPCLPASEDWKIEGIIENTVLRKSLGMSDHNFAQEWGQRLAQCFSVFSYLGFLPCPRATWSFIYSIVLVKLTHCFLLSLMRSQEVHESTGLRSNYIFWTHQNKHNY